MGSNGQGFLSYFDSSWLWGRTSYNIIMLDYGKAMVVYGCDHFAWIYKHEYFWVLTKAPMIKYEEQMYYINYIKSKFPSYKNKVPIFFQGE
jgi:hypothetical protein